ncbi:hypothetical protein BCR43DRAFT_488304 [Syncephalastrum racemosum]|uniref:Arrestin-like N-terminal domain-containing protein n=1 Tax=Syncephalastrum racemosum TaxID=13706 RepID=A0A1X2HIH7_SYNRA|nr:hypothetical protein BCR43DRAFT_488304 [Syncephalastrum racemosum]
MNENTIARLSIELLPHFGWTIHDEPVYSPGSTVQGTRHLVLSFISSSLSLPLADILSDLLSCLGVVRIHCDDLEVVSTAATRLRIVFHGAETTHGHREQLFGTQHYLWRDKDPLTLEYPFTAELPMIQLPPTVLDNTTYSFKMGLTAFLEGDHSVLARTFRPVIYRPLLETRLVKQTHAVSVPLACRPSNSNSSAMNDNNANATLSLYALDYVPGDALSAHVSLPADDPETSVDVHVELIQTTQSTLFKNSTKLAVVIASTHQIIQSKDHPFTVVLGMDVPESSVPTFTYGRVTTIRYHLLVKVVRKQPGLFSRSRVTTFDAAPITIGTLPYGVHAPEGLVPYTLFDTVFATNKSQSSNRMLPVPKFFPPIESEDVPPPYEPTQLPQYQVLTPPSLSPSSSA